MLGWLQALLFLGLVRLWGDLDHLEDLSQGQCLWLSDPPKLSRQHWRWGVETEGGYGLLLCQKTADTAPCPRSSRTCSFHSYLGLPSEPSVEWPRGTSTGCRRTSLSQPAVMSGQSWRRLVGWQSAILSGNTVRTERGTRSLHWLLKTIIWLSLNRKNDCWVLVCQALFWHTLYILTHLPLQP